MKNINKHILFYFVLFVIASACDTENDLIEEVKNENPTIPEPGPEIGSSGSADFSNYVSIGNSLTAGLMDGALYTRGQSHSFPNLLAAKFALDGGGEFNQPDINSESGFNVSFNSLEDAFTGPATFGKLVLDLSIPGPVPTTPGDALNMVPDNDRSLINNLGVPGMRLIELPVNGYGTLNPFYTRFALDVATSSVLEQAITKQPSFITLWLGNNDVFTWASGGGVGPDAADNPGVLDQDPSALVSTQSFEAALQGSLSALFGSNPGLQGIIINIPNITLLPFFQAVKWNAIAMDEVTATLTNEGYAGYNAALLGLTNPALESLGITPLTQDEVDYRTISFSAGDNGIVVVDDQLNNLADEFDVLLLAGQITEQQRQALAPFEQVRQLKSAVEEPRLAQFQLPGELVTLSAGSVLGTLADPENPASVIGVGVPLGDEYTLTVDEIGLAISRLLAFNMIIQNQAGQSDDLHLFDANSLFTNIAVNGGYTIANGFTYAPDFSPNGIFSVDGVHVNPVGQAIIANELLALIEDKFDADLPKYDVSEFSTVLSLP